MLKLVKKNVYLFFSMFGKDADRLVYDKILLILDQHIMW